jgi:hypothetical protein
MKQRGIISENTLIVVSDKRHFKQSRLIRCRGFRQCCSRMRLKEFYAGTRPSRAGYRTAGTNALAEYTLCATFETVRSQSLPSELDDMTRICKCKPARSRDLMANRSTLDFRAMRSSRSKSEMGKRLAIHLSA